MSMLEYNTPMVNGLSSTFFKNPSTTSSDFNGLSSQLFARRPHTPKSPKTESNDTNGISHNLLLNHSASPLLDNTQHSSAATNLINPENSDITLSAASFTTLVTTDQLSVSRTNSVFSSVYVASSRICAALCSYFFKHQSAKQESDLPISRNYVPDLSLSSVDPLYQVRESDKADCISSQCLTVTPPFISFESPSHKALDTQTLTFTNSGSVAISFEIHNNVTYTQTPFNPEMYTYSSTCGTDQAEINFSEQSINLNSGETKTVAITIIKPKTNNQKYAVYGINIHLRRMDSILPDTYIPFNGVIENEENSLVSYVEEPVIKTKTHYNKGRQPHPETDDYQHALLELDKAVELDYYINFGTIADYDDTAMVQNRSLNNNDYCLLNSSYILNGNCVASSNNPFTLLSTLPNSTQVTAFSMHQHLDIVPHLTIIQIIYNIGILMLVHLKYFELI